MQLAKETHLFHALLRGALWGALVLAAAFLPAKRASAQSSGLEGAFAAGKRHYEAKEFEQGLAQLKQVLAAGPQAPHRDHALFYAAECAFQLARLEEAHRYYAEILRDHQDFPETARVIRREFEIGTAFISGAPGAPVKSGIREVGLAILDRLVKEYQEAYFDRGHYLIGLYHYDDGEYERAIIEFERLGKSYPDSEWAAAARYVSALCWLELRQGYDYDLTPILRAERLLSSVVRDFPTAGQVRHDAEAKLREIHEQLAERYIRIARFYVSNDRPRSAEVYLRALLREYPETDAAKTARNMLARLGLGESGG